MTLALLQDMLYIKSYIIHGLFKRHQHTTECYSKVKLDMKKVFSNLFHKRFQLNISTTFHQNASLKTLSLPIN